MNYEEAHTLWNYAPETGQFIWKVEIRGGRNSAFVMAIPGERAGCFSPSTGYRYLSREGKRCAEHRIAFLMMTGELPAEDVDHINGDRADNRWANLRPATRKQNMQNLKGAHRDSITGFLGVEIKRRKFTARICVDGRRIGLGVYETPEEAHAVYLKAKRELHERNTL